MGDYWLTREALDKYSLRPSFKERLLQKEKELLLAEKEVSEKPSTSDAQTKPVALPSEAGTNSLESVSPKSKDTNDGDGPCRKNKHSKPKSIGHVWADIADRKDSHPASAKKKAAAAGIILRKDLVPHTSAGPSLHKASREVTAVPKAPSAKVTAEPKHRRPEALRARFPKLSRFTTKENQEYVTLLQKFRHVQPHQLKTEDKKDFSHFRELHRRVAVEQEEFQVFLEQVAQKNADIYSYMHPEAHEYIKDYLARKQTEIKLYPQYYIFLESMPLVPPKIPQSIPFYHLKTLLQVGDIPKAILPKKFSKKNLQWSRKKIEQHFPVSEETSISNPCSRDSNLSQLTQKHLPHAVLSPSTFKCIMDNQAPHYLRQWEIPVEVRMVPYEDNGMKKFHKTVILDKPLVQKSLSMKERSHLFHKLVMKADSQHPLHPGDFHSSKKTPVAPEPDLSNLETFGTVDFVKDSKGSASLKSRLKGVQVAPKIAARSKTTDGGDCETVMAQGSQKDGDPKGMNDSETKPKGSPLGDEVAAQGPGVSVDEVNMTDSDEDGKTALVIDFKVEKTAEPSSRAEQLETSAKEDFPQADRAAGSRKSESETGSETENTPRLRRCTRSQSEATLKQDEGVKVSLRRMSSPDQSPSKSPKDSAAKQGRKIQGGVSGRLLRKRSHRLSQLDGNDDEGHTIKDDLMELRSRKFSSSDSQQAVPAKRSKNECGTDPAQKDLTDCAARPMLPSSSTAEPKAKIPSRIQNSSEKSPGAENVLNSIMLGQEKLFDRAGRELSQPSHDPSPWSLPVLTKNQPDEWQACEKAEGFDLPKSGYNRAYDLWQLGAFKLLLRCKYHGRATQKPSKRKKPFNVVLTPKMEYQSLYGVEQLTSSEICHDWVSTAVRHNCRLVRSRISALNSEIVMTDVVDPGQLPVSPSTFHPCIGVNLFHNILVKLYSLSEGQYLMTHLPDNPQAQIMIATQTSAGAYDLHQAHTSIGVPPKGPIPWIPFDPTIMTSFHMQHHRIPLTFNPEDKSTKQRFKKKKKKKK